MAGRLEAMWLALLGIAQLSDLGTTALDRALGAVEAMPTTAGVLVAGGVGALAAIKLLLVGAAGTALLLTHRWSRRSHGGLVLHRFVLSGCRVTAVAVVLVSLHNAVLFSSLT